MSAALRHDIDLQLILFFSQHTLLLLQPLSHSLQQVRSSLFPFPILPHLHPLPSRLYRLVFLLSARLLYARSIPRPARIPHSRSFQLPQYYQHCSFEPLPQPSHCSPPPSRSLDNSTLHNPHFHLDVPEKLPLPDIHVVGPRGHRSLFSNVSRYHVCDKLAINASLFSSDTAITREHHGEFS